MECDMDSTLRILRLKQVKEKVGLSRSQIYALISTGHFPRQRSLGARAVGWMESDIDGWITQLEQPNNRMPNPDFRKMDDGPQSYDPAKSI
jgi:prophage regulatory protein